MLKGTLAIAAFLGHLRHCNDEDTMKCVLVCTLCTFFRQ